MAKESCPWCRRSKPDAALRHLDELGLAKAVDSFCWYGLRAGAVCVDKDGVARVEAHGGLRVVGYVEAGQLRLSVANREGQAVLIGAVEIDEDRTIVRAIGDVCRILEWRKRKAVAIADEGPLVILRADEPPEDLDP